MNTLRNSVLVCTFLACANLGPALAQDPPPRQGQRPKPEMTAWWDQPIARDLGLSDQQNGQIRATVADSRGRLIQLRAAVDTAESVLHDLMDQQTVDMGRAQAAIDQVVATHAEMMRAVAQMSLKLRSILTYAQWQQLEQRESQPPPPLPGQPRPKKPQEED
jgi:Spy/CpxP family protein refolding chaperone